MNISSTNVTQNSVKKCLRVPYTIYWSNISSDMVNFPLKTKQTLFPHKNILRICLTYWDFKIKNASIFFPGQFLHPKYLSLSTFMTQFFHWLFYLSFSTWVKFFPLLTWFMLHHFSHCFSLVLVQGVPASALLPSGDLKITSYYRKLSCTLYNV